MEEQICKLIRTKRKDHGLTQKALGLLCGYDEKSAEVSVRRWEAGSRPVPIEKLRVLASVLEVTLDELIP